MAHPIVAPTLKPAPEDPPAGLRPLGALPAQEAQDRYRNIVALVVVAVIFLGVLGMWSYAKVSGSLRDIRASNLSALLEAETRVLLVWIDEKKRDAERWAGTPEVQREAAALARLAARGAPSAQLCASAAQRALSAEIAPYATIEESVAFNLIGRDGTVIASQHAANCGLRVTNPEFMRRIAPVFTGKTVFVRPWLEAERVGDVPGSPLTQPLVWVETPVRGDDGEVIAALGFGRHAGERFAKLLAIGSGDSSRETYFFGARGLMLSASRYESELRAAGVLAAGEGALLRLAIRDPGGDLVAGQRPAANGGERPLTRLAQTAIEGLRAGGLEGSQGVILEPYRNYRGAEVIGAWRWLPEKELAIAVEVEAAEAYAPLQHLQLAFGVLFGFLLASLLAAAGMSLWAARLRLREAKRVGQYTLEREIGEGGMSHVYLARHTHLKRPTAVKVLKAHLASDEMVTRFEREVQLCSQLTHPNTIEIYDYGRTREGTFFYAMEYLHGISLEDLVRREGPLPVSRAVHALRQACGSLKEAHARGLVHRDVKPQNLMLCVRGEQHDVLKVLDFGLVKEVHNPHTRDITQFARVLGTPLYMAPERLRNPADADARSDIYALGAVAHFLVTGRVLFQAQTDHDLVYQVLNTTPPTLAEGGARDVPAALEALVARCLAKQRDARPASIDEVDQVLAEIARQRPWGEDEARAWWRERETLAGS
jgi:tRNA A-37 threonylcarbamoyl transferase component Bud32